MSKVVKKSDLSKPWNRRKLGYRAYAINSKIVEKTFLIICEGKNTEPGYFEAFPVVTAEVKTIGAGRVRTSLINEAIRLKKEENNKGREIWCVFDYDDKPNDATIAADFQNALVLADKHNIKLAWSNDAIELWFVLHHKYLDNALTRQQYYNMLEETWNLEESYEKIGKKKEFCNSLYHRLLEFQSTAINNAEKLAETQKDIYPISQRNPYTTVFLLVEELNKYLKK